MSNPPTGPPAPNPSGPWNFTPGPQGPPAAPATGPPTTQYTITQHHPGPIPQANPTYTSHNATAQAPHPMAFGGHGPAIPGHYPGAPPPGGLPYAYYGGQYMPPLPNGGPAPPVIDPALTRSAHEEELVKTVEALQAETRELHTLYKAQEEHLIAQETSRQGEADSDRNTVLQANLRKAMRNLLMVPEGDRLAPLPHPLGPNDLPRVSPDGVRIYNPNWNRDLPDDKESRDFLKAAIELTIHIILTTLQDNPTAGEPLAALTNKRMSKIAKTYLKSLKIVYKSQNSPTAHSKVVSRNTRQKLRGRKTQVAKKMRRQIPAFRAAYGEEETVGVDELVLTDWISSEYSDNEGGAATQEDFDTHRNAAIGIGNEGWEVRRMAWKSKALRRIYLRLQKGHRDQLKLKHKKGNNSTPRYTCIDANSNDRAPKLAANRGILPYVSCVSARWARRTGNSGLLLVQDPPSFTIFKLEIPDEDLDAVDLAYEADCERYEKKMNLEEESEDDAELD
ncbi:hypothetical protein NLJ89_g9731 [Agrocybe chaxingu]|uniref:Uncharacterized protein n=1 Tax=Agrocybe chaxingu TaxID=84603 RepID=A0A9W8MPK5_9AGAR|nr:hypothetical protein NLJ89_g9731 [Agrocybe chaxingu]